MNSRTTALCMAAFAAAVPAHAADTFKIGLVTTLTTPSAVVGRDVVDAINLAIADVGGTIGGKKIELLAEDDAMKPELGRQKVEKLLGQDNVDILTGINWSNVLLASRKPIVESGKIFISTNAGPSELAGKLCNQNIFFMRGQNDMVPMALGEILNERGIKKIYAIAPNYAAGRDMVAGVERTFKGEIVGRDFTKWGDDPQLDFSAELSKAKASGATAVFAFYPGRASGAFARQYDQSGIADAAKLYSVYTLDQLALPALKDAGAKSILGSTTTDYWSPDIQNPENQKFLSGFRAKYNRWPSDYAAAAYDMIPRIKAAVEAAGGTDTAKLRDALRAADYHSIFGKYAVSKNGYPINQYYAEQVVDAGGTWTLNGKDVVLKNTQDPYVGECKSGS